MSTSNVHKRKPPVAPTALRELLGNAAVDRGRDFTCHVARVAWHLSRDTWHLAPFHLSHVVKPSRICRRCGINLHHFVLMHCWIAPERLERGRVHRHVFVHQFDGGAVPCLLC